MRIKTYLALALAGAVSMNAAIATTFDQQYDTVGLAKAAEVAVVGKVVGSRTERTDAGFVTIVNVDVGTAIWGTNASTIQVEVPGGTVKYGRFTVGQSQASAPVLPKGTEAIFMLKSLSTGGNFTLVGMSNGLLSVQSTAQGKVVTLPGAGKALPVADAMRELNEARTTEKPSNGLR